MEALRSPYAILHLILPILSVLSFGRCLPTRGLAWCVMAGAALYEVVLLCTALALGYLEILFPVYYRAALTTFAVITLGFAIVAIPAIFRALKGVRYRPALVDILIIPTVLLFFYITWLEIKHDWTEGPNFFDSMAYHIPRAFMWSWHGNFHPWRTAVWHQIGNVVGGSATMLPITLMGRGWIGGAWTGMVCGVGSAAALFVIARTWNLSMRSSLLSSLILLACPVVGLRFSDLSTDIGASFPVLAGVALFRTISPLGKGIFAFIVLGAVGVAVKQYVMFPVLLLALVMFLPRTKEILSNSKTIAGLVGGVAVAAVLCLLSFYPLYEGFGKLFGDHEAMMHSSFYFGWKTVVRVTEVMTINWILEPLSALHLLERMRWLPEKTHEVVFNNLGLSALYSKFCQSDVWYPIFTPFNTRSGIIPIVLLPWLLMAVKRGYRWIVASLFIALCLTQISIFSVNYWASRFVIIPLAAFALLWGVRAEKNPFIVSFVALIAMYAGYRYVKPIRGELYGYHPSREHMREVAPLWKEGEFMWLLSIALTNDAHWGGRLGQFRYEYVTCPLDGNWNRLFTELKNTSRWFLLPGNAELIKPGPSYDSRLGPVCPNDTISNLKKRLTETGWRYKLTMPGLYELWTTASDAELNAAAASKG